MNLIELPGIFPRTAQKLARKSPQAINAKTMVVKGREGTDTNSRAFYLAVLGRTYQQAGFLSLVLAGLVAIIFRENAPSALIFPLWGIAVGFLITSTAVDYRLTKFQLLFAGKPTEQQLNEALRKTPSNLMWILGAIIAGGVPYLLIEVLPNFS